MLAAEYGLAADADRAVADVTAELDRIEGAALAAPFPTADAIPEFNES